MKAKLPLRKWAICMLVPLGLFGQNSGQHSPLSFEHNAEVKDAQYSEDGKFLVSVSVNGLMKLWEAESGTYIRSFSYAGPWSPNFKAEFSHDGKAVAVVNGRGGKVWNTKFGDVIGSLFGFGDEITSFHFSHNSKWLIAASEDGTALLYNVESGAQHHRLNHAIESFGKGNGKYGITAAGFCNDDRVIITGSAEEVKDSHILVKDSVAGTTRILKYDSSLLLWDMKTGKVRGKVSGYPFDVSHDGTLIVTGTMNVDHNVARVWEASTGKLIHSLSGQTRRIDQCEFNTDDKWIMTVSPEAGTVMLWDTHTGKSNRNIQLTPGIRYHVSLSPQANLVSVHAADTARIYDSTSGKLLFAAKSHYPTNFSPDGRDIITFVGNHAMLVEAETGKPVMIGKDGRKKTVKMVKD